MTFLILHIYNSSFYLFILVLSFRKKLKFHRKINEISIFNDEWQENRIQTASTVVVIFALPSCELVNLFNTFASGSPYERNHWLQWPIDLRSNRRGPAVNVLTLCGTRKLQFVYVEILPEFKNRPMSKIVNAICQKMIKVKKSLKISGMNFSSWEFWVSVAKPDTLCFKGLNGA